MELSGIMFWSRGLRRRMAGSLHHVIDPRKIPARVARSRMRSGFRPLPKPWDKDSCVCRELQLGDLQSLVVGG